MATQCLISYTLDHSIQNNTLFLKLTISNLLKCLSLQAKFYDLSNNPTTDWIDIAYIVNLQTDSELSLNNEISKIDFRLYSCCSVPDPDPPLDDVPCDVIQGGPDTVLNACGATPLLITDGYVKSSDLDRLDTPFNPIMIPRNMKLNVQHDLNTCEISVNLCSVRCIVPTPTPTPTQTGTSTPTPTPTITVTSTVTPTLTTTSTLTPTTTPTPTVTKSPGASPTPTASITPTVSVTRTVTPTVTPTMTQTSTPTPTRTQTPTPSRPPRCCNYWQSGEVESCTGFSPFTHITTLPTINFTSYKKSVPIDLDNLCSVFLASYYGIPYQHPLFGLPIRPYLATSHYKRFELYTNNIYGITDTPTIDGVSYITAGLPRGSLVKIKNFNNSTSEEVREWISKSFIFNLLIYTDPLKGTGVDNIKYLNYWPYTDLFWVPGASIVSTPVFTPKLDTVYVILIPC